MTDRRGNIIRLPPPPIPPKFVRELSITEDTGSTAVNAVEYGIPTVREHTPDLDAEQRRLRATVYFVRYNDLTDEQKLICSGPNVSKHEWLGHKEAYSKLRKKLQAEMIGIGQNSQAGLFNTSSPKLPCMITRFICTTYCEKLRS